MLFCSRFSILVLVFAALLAQRGQAKALSGEVLIEFINSKDTSRQQAIAYVPDRCINSPCPLLVVAHYMGGNRFTAKGLNYHAEAEKRGWMVVCPELHGLRSKGETSMAALVAQYDVIGAINYMKANYKVDAGRVYMAGRSMGGMLTQIMLAKFPDIFAAGVAGQGISHLNQWVTQSPRFLDPVVAECKPYLINRFEWDRRSSIYYAGNFKYSPLILWHGTNDTWVLPEQSENLLKAIKKRYNYQPEIRWLVGAPHSAANYPASWVCDQLMHYENTWEGESKLSTRFYDELSLVTDESKSFFWLDLIQHKSKAFSKVDAVLDSVTLVVSARNLKIVTVDLQKIPTSYHPKYYKADTDVPLNLRVVKGSTVMAEIPLQKNSKGALYKKGPVNIK